MSRLAVVLPGQGAQYVGMGKKIAEQFPAAAQIFQRADDALKFKLSTLCFEGPADQLNQTEYAQPAILTTSLAIWEVVKEKTDLKPAILAGLSLGEYTALVISGALTLEEAVPLVHTRGRLMQNTVAPGLGLMEAVLGLEAEKVEEICRQAEGCVEIANYNCPGQVVISGETQAVQQTAAHLKEAGARVTPLPISVPCHCSMLYDSAQKFKHYLEPLHWGDFGIPVVSNYTAQAHTEEEVVPQLVKQLYCSVRWEQSVRHMAEQSDYFIEVGPGSSLSGLIRRIERGKMLGAVEDAESLEKIMEKVNHYVH